MEREDLLKGGAEGKSTIGLFPLLSSMLCGNRAQ
jgi:hypothetical protein